LESTGSEKKSNARRPETQRTLHSDERMKPDTKVVSLTSRRVRYSLVWLCEHPERAPQKPRGGVSGGTVAVPFFVLPLPLPWCLPTSRAFQTLLSPFFYPPRLLPLCPASISSRISGAASPNTPSSPPPHTPLGSSYFLAFNRF
jgi:hypothetical protein